MQKTDIEWADYSSNPIKGYCPNNCTYCYAHRLYNRYHWDKTIRLELELEAKGWKKLKEPSRIFVGSTIDMYHPDISRSWTERIIEYSEQFPQHTFITLTKFPENLDYFNFPENWWIGTTVDNNNQECRILHLFNSTNSGITLFVSFEPLLTFMETHFYSYMDWIIIGGLTPKSIHKTEWIDDIVLRADKLNIPVFIKNNANYPIEKKEFPI